MGHPTSQIEGSFTMPSARGLMFVFTPTSPFSSDDANQAANWVRLGGVLVYPSEQGDPELDRALAVTRINGLVSGSTEVPNPGLDGGTTVSGGDTAMPFDVPSVPVPVLRSRD